MPEPLAPIAAVPQRIRLDREARAVRITWGDGHESAYDWEYLRWHCPCAFCQGEGGRPGELQMARSLRPEQTEMADLELTGRYALSPTWADGHHTGIYTWRSLRSMCPCEACRQLPAD